MAASSRRAHRTAADDGLEKSAPVNPGNRRPGAPTELARPQEKNPCPRKFPAEAGTVFFLENEEDVWGFRVGVARKYYRKTPDIHDTPTGLH